MAVVTRQQPLLPRFYTLHFTARERANKTGKGRLLSTLASLGQERIKHQNPPPAGGTEARVCKSVLLCSAYYLVTGTLVLKSEDSTEVHTNLEYQACARAIYERLHTKTQLNGIIWCVWCVLHIKPFILLVQILHT